MIIAATGMARSGTSLAASLLHSLGVSMGSELLPADRGNVRGYYEDVGFLELQGRMLAALSDASAADAWPELGWPPRASVPADTLDAFAAPADALVASRCAAAAGRIWGWKDPRTTLLLDFWRGRLPMVRFLLMYRAPWEVARSLRRVWKSRLPPPRLDPLRLWAHYNASILAFFDAHRDLCVLVEAGSLALDPLTIVRVLHERFRLEPESWGAAALRDLTKDVAQPSLLTPSSAPDDLPGDVALLWQRLEERADVRSPPSRPPRKRAVIVRRGVDTMLIRGSSVAALRPLRAGLRQGRAKVRQLGLTFTKPPFSAFRRESGPILSVDCFDSPDATTVGGASPIAVPAWVRRPLGRYYLYFAHHHGLAIRLAYADSPEGPWTIHRAPVLAIGDTPCEGHIAGPDVHVDEDRQIFRMYFHGLLSGPERSVTLAAVSRDGLSFSSGRDPLGPPCFRVFHHDAWFFALARRSPSGALLLRARSPEGPFEPGPSVLPRLRHAAVLKRDTSLFIFYSRVGDAPESLLVARLEPDRDFRRWHTTAPALVLAPEREWEGAGEPDVPSHPGAARQPVRQLRDPGVLSDGPRHWIFYSTAGERGIAVARLDPA